MPLKCRNQRDIKLLVKYDFSSWRKKLEQDTKPAKTWQTFGRECHQTFKLHVCVFYLENVQAQAIAFSVSPALQETWVFFTQWRFRWGQLFSSVFLGTLDFPVCLGKKIQHSGKYRKTFTFYYCPKIHIAHSRT